MMNSTLNPRKRRTFDIFADFRFWFCWLTGMAALAGYAAEPQALKYASNEALGAQLKTTAESHSQLVRVEKLAETAAKNPLWLVELGTGTNAERKRRPALLLVAGIEGHDLVGTACAVAWIEQMAVAYSGEEKARRLLDATTIYVFPRLNPDAATRGFAKPRLEAAVNNTPVDDDHDGLVDEDGPDDLNGDGAITWMRVQDPEGEFILDPAEPRLLVKADRAKGEKGSWRYLKEGRDNDGDEVWNEDGPGGVNLNRNFPYNYRFFGPGAGRHQMSEVETRTLADFVVDHPNIGIVFTFGAADNLVQTPKSDGGNKRPPTTIQEEDAPYYRELGKSYREALGLKKELQTVSESGTFSDWMYFHRGRLSLAARAWSPTLQVELAKGTAASEADKVKEPEATPDDKAEVKKDTRPPSRRGGGPAKPPEPRSVPDEKRAEEDRAFLKWLDENSPELFLTWRAYAHPDFPGKKVEIGGFMPLATTNPPEKSLPDLARKHGQFLTQLADRLPRVGLRKTEAKHLGESVYEVTVQVENTGYLPTALNQGSLTREVLPTRVRLDLEPEFILSGSRVSMLGPIEGSGGMRELRYIIHAKDRKQLGVEVISVLGGSLKTTIDLKEGN